MTYEVLKVTPEGEFIWHPEADRLIEEDFSNSPSMSHILRRLREAEKRAATEESSATQEPVAWDGKPLIWKLVPVVPTQAMLDEMNLTGREGYDEVMGDGFSASLYGAALIAAPAQPKAEQEQRCYCGDIYRLGVIHREDSFCDEHPQPKREPLTDEQIAEISVECATVTPSDIYFARAIEAAHGIGEKK